MLGHWGDTHGRKHVLLVCMFLMGFSTMAVGLLPTYQQVGLLAPVLLVLLRLIQGFAVAGEISGASSMILEHAPFGRRGFFASFTLQGVQAGQILAAAVFLPLAHFMPRGRVQHLGLAHAVPAQLRRHRRRLHHPPRGRGDAGLRRGRRARRGPAGADRPRPSRISWADMLRVVCMALMNVIPVVATDLRRRLRGAAGLRHRLRQGRLPVDPGAGQHRRGAGHSLSSATCPTGSAAGRRSSSARSRSGLLSFAYLYAISIHSVPLAIVMSLLMWGVVYQGYNAVFPSFYPELFPTRDAGDGDGDRAERRHHHHRAAAGAVRRRSRRPGSANIPLTIGAITFAITAICAIAACSARETYRIHLNDLGHRDAMPVPKPEYDRLRAEASVDRIRRTDS